MSDDFDMHSILNGLANMSDEERKKLFQEGIAESMEDVTQSVAPRIWAILQAEMARSPEDLMRLNAILNAAQYAVNMWLAVCTNGSDQHDDDILEASSQNLRVALKHGRPATETIASAASTVGRPLLMEDALKGLAGVLDANTQVLAKVAKDKS